MVNPLPSTVIMAASVKSLYLFGAFTLLLSGCGPKEEISVEEVEEELAVESSVGFPVEEYFERRTFKVFGQYVQDRFVGYHAADDIEFGDVEEEVPVVAIADGTVTRVGTVGGYGGFISIFFSIEGREIHAIYGHV